MFDAPFDLLAVMITIAAFLMALKASTQTAELRRRVNALEAAAAAARPVMPPPLMPQQREVPAAPRSAEPPALAPEAELAPPLAIGSTEPRAGITPPPPCLRP